MHLIVLKGSFFWINVILKVVLRRLVAGFPPRRLGFEPSSGYVVSVADEVALGQWGRFSPSISVSPSNCHSTDCFALIIIIIYHQWLV
jgi:hypothetical protein